jgi:hypothetical protein
MRKKIDITIEDEGRDQGKVFRITEMPAVKAEKWAARALVALLHSGVEIPDNIAKAGLAGIAAMGVSMLSGIEWDKLEPLLDEMMECVQVQAPNAKLGFKAILPQADDIEEVTTLFKLRQATLELHLGFSLADKLKSLRESAEEKETSQPAQTSQE